MTGNVLVEIGQERKRQDAKWGQQNHPDGTGPNAPMSMGIAETIRDATRDECDAAAKDGTLTWRHILNEEVMEAYAEDDTAALRKELIQSAAVIVAWIEAIDRRNPVSEQEWC